MLWKRFGWENEVFGWICRVWHVTWPHPGDILVGCWTFARAFGARLWMITEGRFKSNES